MGTDDRVDGTGIATMRAADAKGFVNNGDRRHHNFSERDRVSAKQIGQALDSLIAAGRTQIDGDSVFNDSCRIRSASWISTLRALCLRQHVVDLFDKISLIRWQAARCKAQSEPRDQGNRGDC